MRSIWKALPALMLAFSIIPPLQAAETPAQAIPSHPMLRDELVLTIGVYYPRSTTAASLQAATGGLGAIISFEDTLALEKRRAVPSLGAFWRATENWRIDLEYFVINRDATRVLAQDIEWGDVDFPSGVTVDSTFDFYDLRISAAYAFFKRKDKELGIGLGLHVAGIEASIQSAGVGAEAADVTAPLPVVSLYGMFALTDEWAVNLRADWLSLTYGDYSGDVRNVEINALYQPFRNIGFGLGVRTMVFDVEMRDEDWRGRARISFQGPTAFMTVSF